MPEAGQVKVDLRFDATQFSRAIDAAQKAFARLGEHAQEVVCRWPATEAEGERDEARAPRRFVLDAGGERTYFCSDPCHRALQAERDEARSELRLLTQAHVEAVRELGELRAQVERQGEALARVRTQLASLGDAAEGSRDKAGEHSDHLWHDGRASAFAAVERMLDETRATQQAPTEDPR